MGLSSMSGLYIGVSSIQVNQASLQTTAHNLSNLDTEGYTRQQVLMADCHYSTLAHGAVYTEQTGLGTSMQTVRQVRDEFADKQYRLESGRGAFYDSMEEVGQELETYFGNDVDDEKLKNTMTDFWESLNELQKTPDSIVNRETLIQSAEEMLEQAKLVYNQTVEYQKNINEKIQSQVDEINEMASKILELNKEIIKVESNDVEHANDLRDQRNQILDTLGTYGEITYREDDVGCVTVNFEGIPLVSEDRTFELATEKIRDDSELLNVVWKDHANMDVYNFQYLPSAETSTDVGSLKGLVYARGSMIGNYTLMDVKTSDAYKTEKKRDGSDYTDWEDYFRNSNEGYSLSTPATDEEMEAAYSKYYEKNIEPYLITNVEAELDYMMHNIVTTINDILCPNKDLDIAVTATDADGNSVTIPAGTKVLDTENAPIGLGDDGEPGTELFTRTNMSRYTTYTYTDASGNSQKLYVYNEEDTSDQSSLYSLTELEVNPDLIKNPSKMPLSNSDHSNAQDVCNDLLDAWSSEGDYNGIEDSGTASKSNMKTLTPNTLTGFNFQSYYNAMVGELANDVNSYTNISDSQQIVANQLDDRRQTVAGVNSDEELTNMIQYQQAFNAASRYINVVSEMLETLIKNVGQA